jgi:hypothetical protein
MGCHVACMGDIGNMYKVSEKIIEQDLLEGRGMILK